MTSVTMHPVVNRDREEIRIPSPLGPRLLDYLTRRGVRGRVRTDRAGDVIALEGEPEMCRVVALLADWERQTDPTRG
ncbi:MAG: hypothetical protein JWO38_7933 [Gemmataceae bacterium]|nr:hypothetical protein [Gemmataceae bacterium]